MGIFKKDKRTVAERIRAQDRETLIILLRISPVGNPWVEQIVSEILSRIDLSLDDLLHLLDKAPENLFPKIWDRILKNGIDPSELAELFTNRNGSLAELAFVEFLSRRITADHAIRILTESLKKDPRKRKIYWEKIKKRAPRRHHLRVIADMELGAISSEAQKMMSRLDRRRSVKAAKKISDLIRQQS
ncbi:MAG: hypothetical protein A2365_01365 [Candidatus Nealsonbacteria bacterium RIFOXYB1_FULL_40_15]|uniref:Uncharacterized protein n=2 Tax=Candidatus Nealsoniibacteriota TaxID=1817911 RepID=A0A1G2EPZ0_9BACT|nr:MAG: hypothetical protein A2365_01365 [Candidatus Nealsonbacteria bacterium RIFOXYB1_FULL_40_15]OGZ27866.1 MAG: hypothetical protein A2427_04095 [Candidatus Nealsonbacteria bacterium RIFOXYC1_FULL_40_7]OGZ28025.1 MAG: hypothetical protein A2562_01445 [Candidatus Nealsonbacteria bacterium RIFOXYD1_FULL_39_11]